MRPSQRVRLTLESLEKRELLTADLLPQLATIPQSSNARNLVRSGDFVYFTVDLPNASNQVWRTDGTAEGTTSLGVSSDLRSAVTAENGFYFVSSELGKPLYRSEGTRDTTVRLTDENVVVSPFMPSDPFQLVEFNGEVYFFGLDRDAERFPNFRALGVMKTSGTAEGTDFLVDPVERETRHRFLGEWDGRLHYVNRTRDPLSNNYHATDGTTDDSEMLDDLSILDTTLHGEIGDKLIGVTEQGAGYELSVVPKSTMVPELIEINADGGSTPYGFLVEDGQVYFVANDGVHGAELWASNGTAEGTRLLSDIVPGSKGSLPDSLTWFDGGLYFSATDAVWRYDPTTEATTVVRQFEDSPASLGPAWFTVAGDSLYFVANGGDGEELWSTDGTADGTSQVVDLYPGKEGSDPSFLTTLGDSLIFTAREPGVGNELRVLDTTSNEVQLLADLRPGQREPRLGFPRGLHVYNDVAYFRYDNHTHGTELWRSDGTADGTYMLRDINPGAQSSGPRQFFEFNGLLYFLANDGEHGYEIWSTDGTASNTQLVKDTWPGIDGVIDLGFEVIGDKFYFTANDGEHGMELWESDGTGPGTQRITDLQPGEKSTPISFIDEHQGNLIFYVDPSAVALTEATDGIWQWDLETRTATELFDADTFSSKPLQEVFSFHDRIVVLEGRGQLRWNVDGNFEPLGSSSRVRQLEVFDDSIVVFDGGSEAEYVNSDFEITPAAFGQPLQGYEVRGAGGTIYVTKFQFSENITNSLLAFSPESNAVETVFENVPIASLHESNDMLFASIQNEDADGFELWRIDGETLTVFETDLSLIVSEVTRLNEKTLVVAEVDGREIMFNVNDSDFVEGNPIRPLIAGVDEVDALFAAVRTGATDLKFDYNGDFVVFFTDIDYAFDMILETDRADLDLDGTVGFSDFLKLSENFGKTTDAKWSEGDINGDGTITFADFLLLSEKFGQ